LKENFLIDWFLVTQKFDCKTGGLTMHSFLFSIIYLFIFLSLAYPLSAQTKKTTQSKTPREIIEGMGNSEPIGEDESEKEKLKKMEEDKYYAKLQYPPGFYQGAFFISFIGGSTLAPSGGFIQHEKNYDDILQRRIYNREVDQGPVVSPDGNGVYFRPTYIPGNASQFDFEYAWKEKIGVGFSIMKKSIEARRQDIIPGLSYSREVADIIPRRRTVYEGVSMSFLATYHPLPRTFFDPYLVARVGVVSFTGEAHANIVHDRFVYSNQITNGIGGSLGFGTGLNIYLGRYLGIKTEIDYTKEYLKADQFNNRTLNSYQVMIGLFVNLSNLQYKLENE
jgi:hypothetical protein